MSDFGIGVVPCNGCVLCCRGDAVRILPGDGDDLCTEPHPYRAGALMLAHKANGDCIYLGERGCTIWARRPRMCRTMDCRVLAQRFSLLDVALMPTLPVAIYARGRELLGLKRSASVTTRP